MMLELKPFTEETLDDALCVVRVRFGEEACSQARLILKNPLRRYCSSAGEIAYENGRPVAFQAAILRRGVVNGREFIVIVGGMLAMLGGASPVSLVTLMKSTIKQRGESVLFLANTSIPTSMKMNRMLGVKGRGCDSCSMVRFAVLRWGQFARFYLKGKLPRWMACVGDLIGSVMRCFCWRRRRTATVPKRLMAFEAELFDPFWCSYSSSANGIVLSRTVEELDWAFGEGVRCGRNILLVRSNENGIVGYVVLRARDDDRVRWMIVDWIALGDDRDVLSDLLLDAISELRKATPAAFLECIGFRMDVQDVIHRHLPFTRKAPNNSTIFKAFSEEVSDALSVADEHGWFFGPYDGDRCIA